MYVCGQVTMATHIKVSWNNNLWQVKNLLTRNSIHRVLYFLICYNSPSTGNMYVLAAFKKMGGGYNVCTSLNLYRQYLKTVFYWWGIRFSGNYALFFFHKICLMSVVYGLWLAINSHCIIQECAKNLRDSTHIELTLETIKEGTWYV